MLAPDSAGIRAGAKGAGKPAIGGGAATNGGGTLDDGGSRYRPTRRGSTRRPMTKYLTADLILTVLVAILGIADRILDGDQVTNGNQN